MAGSGATSSLLVLVIGGGYGVGRGRSTSKRMRWTLDVGRWTSNAASAEGRHDLVAEQPERLLHQRLRDTAAGVDLGEDAVDAEPILKLAQPIGDHRRRPDNDPL